MAAREATVDVPALTDPAVWPAEDALAAAEPEPAMGVVVAEAAAVRPAPALVEAGRAAMMVATAEAFAVTPMGPALTLVAPEALVFAATVIG